VGKLPNVTMAELKAADEIGNDLHATIADLLNRLEKGYSDPIESPVALARSFLALSRTTADLSSQLLFRAALQEDKAELEKLLTERQGLEAMQKLKDA
jgi:hemerythrin-like domain-containing protein